MALFNRNPVLAGLERTAAEGQVSEGATYQGVALKSIWFIALTLLSAIAAYVIGLPMVLEGNETLLIVFVIVCPIVAFIMAMVSAFSVSACKVTGSIYAVAEGLFLGFLSALVSLVFDDGGIVMSALIATVAVFAVMAVLYYSGVIRVGAFFRRFMLCALLAAVLVSLLMMILYFAGVMSAMDDGTYFAIMIGVTILMIVIASLMLLLDFDNITQTVEHGLDKRFEWRAAFGLTLTLVWLYINFLRLFILIAGRRK